MEDLCHSTVLLCLLRMDWSLARYLHVEIAGDAIDWRLLCVSGHGSDMLRFRGCGRV